MAPTVSAVVPVYNGARFLPFALHSILGQSHPISEILIVDDGSTDDLQAVLSQYRSLCPGIRCVTQDNAGAAVARNSGAALASGEFLAFLDADDLWLEDKTAAQLAALAADPALDAVFGHAEQFAEPGMEQRIASQLRIMPAEMPSAMLIRKHSFERVGPYPALRIGEPIAWLAQARARGLRSEILPSVVYRRRVHANNTTLQANARAHYLSAVRAALSFSKTKES